MAILENFRHSLLTGTILASRNYRSICDPVNCYVMSVAISHQSDTDDMRSPDPTACYPSDAPTIPPFSDPPRAPHDILQPPTPHSAPILVTIEQPGPSHPFRSPLEDISQFDIPIGYKLFQVPKNDDAFCDIRLRHANLVTQFARLQSLVLPSINDLH